MAFQIVDLIKANRLNEALLLISDYDLFQQVMIEFKGNQSVCQWLKKEAPFYCSMYEILS